MRNLPTLVIKCEILLINIFDQVLTKTRFEVFSELHNPQLKNKNSNNLKSLQ